MKRYAFLCGSAPWDYRQKKLESLFESLIDNSVWHVDVFPNGINEFLLEYALNNILSGNAGEKANGILLYFCCEESIKESDCSIWLCGDEIRKDVINHYEKLSRECEIDFQVVYDCDCEFVSEESLGYEKAF